MEYEGGSAEPLESLNDLSGNNSNEGSFWDYRKEDNWKEDQECFLMHCVPVCIAVGGAE